MLTTFLEKIIPHKNTKGTDSPQENAATTLPEVPEWKAGETIIDRYTVNEVFSGAMGRVYIAQHLGWKIPVAIKVPKPEVLNDKEGFKRTYNEAQNWVRMGMHPNVAACYYILKIQKIPHIFIEHVDGGDLSSWIKTGRCKDLRTTLSLAIQFCHGMEFTHSRGIIHRDIKPQNVLITKNALLKITDFGIIQTTHVFSGKTAAFSPNDDPEKTVGFRGTPGYASPEQFKDTHTVDKRTDIFSFGICLWLMLCGRKPYLSNQIDEKTAPPSPGPGVNPFPTILTQILDKSVAFNPEDRYQNFEEFRHELNQAYLDLFKIDCPYMELDFADLQAENLNNRAVSFFELDKIKEGRRCLSKALEIHDTLPEAIYNHILFKWKYGKTQADHLLRQIEAARHRLPETGMLDALGKSIKCAVFANTWQDKSKITNSPAPRGKQQYFPEYTLCAPKNSLDVFRSTQLHQSTQSNIQDLFAKKEYESCFNVLLTGWDKIGYRKDRIFIDTYEKLLKLSNKKTIKNIIRLSTIPGKEVNTKNLLYIPGTNRSISLNTDNRVLVRPLTPKKRMHVLKKHPSISCIAVSPDGLHLALAGENGKISLLSTKTGKETKTFQVKDSIETMAFSHVNNNLSLGGASGCILTIDITTGQSSMVAARKSGPVRSITYFSKGTDFVTGSEDGTLRFWPDSKEECIRIVEAHAMPVTTLSAASNDLFFLSGSSDRTIKLWDRQTGQCMKSIEAHDDVISAAIMLPDSNYFVSGSDDDILKIWALHSGEYTLALDGRGDGICGLSTGPEPHIFLSSTRNGTIIIWMVVYDLGFY